MGSDNSMGGSCGTEGGGKDLEDGESFYGENYTGVRRFYYAGCFYHITNEAVDKREIGGEQYPFFTQSRQLEKSAKTA